MRVMRFFRRVDDEATKKGMDIIEQLCGRPNLNLLASYLRGLPLVSFAA